MYLCLILNSYYAAIAGLSFLLVFIKSHFGPVALNVLNKAVINHNCALDLRVITGLVGIPVWTVEHCTRLLRCTRLPGGCGPLSHTKGCTGITIL